MAMLTHCLLTAYWIAFGPHGPRALPPPGEGMKVLTYVILAVIASGALFGFTRSFARGDPRTMTKEYQEATNEYLKVRCLSYHAAGGIEMQGSHTDVYTTTGEQDRAYYWCVERGLQGQGHGPERSRSQGLVNASSRVPARIVNPLDCKSEEDGGGGRSCNLVLGLEVCRCTKSLRRSLSISTSFASSDH